MDSTAKLINGGALMGKGPKNRAAWNEVLRILTLWYTYRNEEVKEFPAVTKEEIEVAYPQ